MLAEAILLVQRDQFIHLFNDALRNVPPPEQSLDSLSNSLLEELDEGAEVTAVGWARQVDDKVHG